MNSLEIILGSMFFFAFNLSWVLYMIDDKEIEMEVAVLIFAYILGSLAALLTLALDIKSHYYLKFVPFGDALFDYVYEILGIDKDTIYSNDTANGGITDREGSLTQLPFLLFPIIMLCFLLLFQKTFKIYQKNALFLTILN